MIVVVEGAMFKVRGELIKPAGGLMTNTGLYS